MFIAEFGAGVVAGSTALMADASDMLGDALVYENERLNARMNQFFDRVESLLRQCLRPAAEQNGSPTPTVDANALAAAITAFVVGKLQRYVRSGFRRSPTEAVDAALQATPAGSLEPLGRALDLPGDPLVATQVLAYLAEGRRALGVIPTQDTLVLERFFDESGGMQLVLHAPFGSRINRAWGLALRKKFCQGFNFELQAAATEEGIILSLSAAHSFPLQDVFRYVHPNALKETLTQAILQSPIFETRWRWASTLALAVPRNRGGSRVPNQLQRMNAEDVLQSVFPDAVACQDNLQGAREVPDHPLVNQALRDALEEAVDMHGLEAVLRRLYAGEIRTVARDLPEPSVLSHELLNSAVYTFLDDAPLEERRTRAVYTRRATDVRSSDDLGALDAAAIERVRQEAWPIANTPDEMYDALMVAGYVAESELAPGWKSLIEQLGERAVKKDDAWVALERKDDGLPELVASRLEVLGPVPERAFPLPVLVELEAQGRILRGRFTPGAPEVEWCDRRLLARIHRYTLSRLRAEIEPVSAADYYRFLLHWQHVAGEDQVRGAEGLAAVIEQLEGFELAAVAWEHDVLPARVADYGREQLDQLCLSGRVAWGRLTPGTKAPLKTSPIALLLREHLAHWAPGCAGATVPPATPVIPAKAGIQSLSSEAAAVRDALTRRGASFFHEIIKATGLLPAIVERGLAELAGAGIATADSFAGLRALLARQDKRRKLIETAGRWSLLTVETTLPLPPPKGGGKNPPSPLGEGRGEGGATVSLPVPLGEGRGEGHHSSVKRATATFVCGSSGNSRPSYVASTSGALPTTTLSGGRPATSASEPRALSREKSTVPCASLTSTHDSARKRSLSVRSPALRVASVFAASVFAASAFAASAFAASAWAACDWIFGASAAAGPADSDNVGAGDGGTLSGAAIGAAAICCGGPPRGATAAGCSAPAFLDWVAGGVGRMKSHQYIAANAMATTTTASTPAFT